MPSRKVQCVLTLALMVAAFALLAVHASFLHERLSFSDRCPICSWGQSLAVGQGAAPILVAISLTGRVAPEPVVAFALSLSCRPFSARAPPPA
jgi:hypothetical protein